MRRCGVGFSNEQRQLLELLQHPSDRSTHRPCSQWPATQQCVFGDRSFPRPGRRRDESSTSLGSRRDRDARPTPSKVHTESSPRGRVHVKDGWPPQRCGLEGHRKDRCSRGDPFDVGAVSSRCCCGLLRSQCAPRSNLGSRGSASPAECTDTAERTRTDGSARSAMSPPFPCSPLRRTNERYGGPRGRDHADGQRAVAGQSMGFSFATISARRGSRNGGSATCSPSVSTFSSTAKPGPSDAISNTMPFGSRKYRLRK
jgi:hypothetical protein